MDTIANTEHELVKFHAYLRDKGLMNERTAYSRIQAAQAVLSVLDANEKSDLAKIDRELAFRRFTNKNGQRFTPESLETYRHRFNAALNEFQAYLRDPASYRPSATSRERSPASQAKAFQSSRVRPLESPRAGQHERTSDLLSFPLPLPSGGVAQLLLPPLISKEDALRIEALVSAMVKALAVEGKPTI
jgi:hypothetical protein